MIKVKPRIYANDSRLVSALQDAFSIGKCREWLHSCPMVFVDSEVYAVSDIFFTADDGTYVNGWLGFSVNISGNFTNYRNGLLFTLIKQRVH